MALKDSDLFVVQRVAGTAEEKGTYKMDAEQIQKYVEAGPSVNFWGTVDLTKAPLGGAAGDQLHDGVMPSNGDLYINDNGGQTGVLVVHPGWDTNNGGPAGENCIAGDRVVWDATPGLWRLIKDAGNVGGIVQSVEGGNGILVTGSQAEPVVNSDFGGDAAWGEAGTDAATKVASVAKVKEYVTAGTIEPGTYVLVSGDTMTGDLKFAEDRSTATPSIQIERSGGIIRKAKLRGQLQADVANNADPDYTLSKDDGLIVKSASTTGNGISVFAGGNTGGAVKATIANDGSATFAGNVDIGDFATRGVRLYSAGGAIDCKVPDSVSDGTEMLRIYKGSSSNITLKAGGSAEFAGVVTGSRFSTSTYPAPGSGILSEEGKLFIIASSSGSESAKFEIRTDGTGAQNRVAVINHDGSAEFAGSVYVKTSTTNAAYLDPAGYIQAWRADGNAPVIYGGTSSSVANFTLKASGSATFAGNVASTGYVSGGSNTSTYGIIGESGSAVGDSAAVLGRQYDDNGACWRGLNAAADTTSIISADGSSDFKGNMTFTNPTNGETNILLNPDGRAFFAGNNSRLRDTFPNATTYIEGGNPDDNEYGRIFMQHKDLPAFGWVKLSPDESFGGTSNDGVVITRGYARETLENVNKIMVFQGAFDLTEYVPYKSDIPNPNPRGIKSIEGAGAIEGVDGSGLRAPHPGDIVSHVPTGFFDDPENTPRQEDWYQHEANGKRFNAFAWRRPSAEDLEADENLTFGHVYTTTGAWVLAASIYDGSANPASHPLFRDPNGSRPQTVSTGDMNGRGRNWYATLGQALDFNPLQLLQNLESVTSVGNDSTTGMFLCCDATLDEPNGTPIRDENDLLIPDRDTAKIKLNDNGSASFANSITAHRVNASPGDNGKYFVGYGGTGQVEMNANGSALFSGTVESTNSSFGFKSNTALGNGGKHFYAIGSNNPSASQYFFYGENATGEAFKVATDGSADFAGVLNVFNGSNTTTNFRTSYGARADVNLITGYHSATSINNGTQSFKIMADGSALFAGGLTTISESGKIVTQDRLTVATAFTGDTKLAHFYGNGNEINFYGNGSGSFTGALSALSYTAKETPDNSYVFQSVTNNKDFGGLYKKSSGLVLYLNDSSSNQKITCDMVYSGSAT